MGGGGGGGSAGMPTPLSAMSTKGVAASLLAIRRVAERGPRAVGRKVIGRLHGRFWGDSAKLGTQPEPLVLIPAKAKLPWFAPIKVVEPVKSDPPVLEICKNTSDRVTGVITKPIGFDPKSSGAVKLTWITASGAIPSPLTGTVREGALTNVALMVAV